jgi:Copper chaperone
MRKIILKVEGMACSHCENAVKNAVMALNGVNAVIVDLKNKSVEIKCEDTIPNEVDIKSAIEDQGYDVI